MNDSTSRMFALVGVLVGVWVVTYWLYEPKPRITRDQVSPTPLANTVSTPISSNEYTGIPQPRTLEPLPEQPAPVVQPQAATPPPEPQPVRTEFRTRVVAPQFREIIAQKGDTSWERIAKRELGDAKLWSAVAKANSFLTSDRIKPGKTIIKIPLDIDNLQGKFVQVEVPVPTPRQFPVAAPGDASPPAGQTYVVQADDTLWSIAKKFYSRGAAWRTIYDANKSVIKDPDRPPVGKSITIPPAPLAAAE